MIFLWLALEKDRVLVYAPQCYKLSMQNGGKKVGVLAT